MEWRRLAAHTGLLTLASVVLSLPASAAAGGAGIALGSSADSSATVVERARGGCDRGYRTGGDRCNAGVRR